MADDVQLIGESKAWLNAVEHVSRIAPLERPILVIGERGTGKELIGERLHFLSRRWEGPYIRVNCAALSEDLLDSELFGHEQGAFTGATKRRIGRFEQANGGTLFLDEIATASMPVQEKLLRVVEYGEFQRLGGEQVLQCDVRVVSATNVDLPALAAAGKFRADLLDRLSFDVITLPPLRARDEDISLLADHFGRRMARELGEGFPGLSPEAIHALERHDWPGNVRELKNMAERMTHRSLLNDPFDPVTFDPSAIDPFASPWRPDPPRGIEPDDDYIGAPAISRTPLPRPSDAFAPLPADLAPVDFAEEVERFERRMVEEALDYTDGHQGKAADRLSLSYHQFRGLLKKYDIDPKAHKPLREPQPLPSL